jgi:hypothetical protein
MKFVADENFDNRILRGLRRSKPELVQLSGSSYQVFDNQTPDNCL